jgi:hypothetical protein
VGKNIHQWDLLLDLAPIPTTIQFSGNADERAKGIKKLHEQIRGHIEKQNEKYRTQANNIKSQ